MNAEHLRIHVIRPVLAVLGGRTDQSVEDLLLGTAAQESHLGEYLVQIRGPAKGIFQIEPHTHDSVWTNYLAFRPELAERVESFATDNRDLDLIGNIPYQVAIARCIYFPVKERIPDTREGQAGYWKAYYNTRAGKGTVEEYMSNYYRFVDKSR